jgi:hypothetical protein
MPEDIKSKVIRVQIFGAFNYDLESTSSFVLFWLWYLALPPRFLFSPPDFISFHCKGMKSSTEMEPGEQEEAESFPPNPFP